MGMLTAHKTQDFLLCMVRCYILAKIFWYIPRVDAWTLNNCVCVGMPLHMSSIILNDEKKRNSTKFCYTNVAWKWNIHKQNGIKTNRREEQKTHVSEWETYEIECCKYLLGWIFSATSSSSLSSSSFSASWFSFAFIEDSLCLTELMHIQEQICEHTVWKHTYQISSKYHKMSANESDSYRWTVGG